MPVWLVRLKPVAFLIILLCLLPGAFLLYRMRGPYRSYRLDEVASSLTTGQTPGRLHVGVAKRDITPDLSRYDTWTDVSGDNHFNPGLGDTYDDRTGTGRFSAVWLGGFSTNRPASGVHDSLWARAIAFRNNGVTLVLVTVDSIGLFHDTVIRIRKSIDPALQLDHVMISSTHTHHAPDTMGIWSRNPIWQDYDHVYLDFVCEMIREAVEEAVHALEPAEMQTAYIEIEPEEGLVNDTREPHYYDHLLGCVRFSRPETDETIAVMLSWGNHPEAVTSRNNLITSDFPHFLREAVENGLPSPNGMEPFGGMCLYFQGSLGGLMTPIGATVPDRDGVTFHEQNTFDKARALGEQVALRVDWALRGPTVQTIQHPEVAYAAQTFFAKVSGHYKWAIMVGLVHPGYWWGGYARSEVNAFRIGDLEILTCPGELFPEIVDGIVESPEGGDFGILPVEVPPLRSVMQGRVNLVINLANDEIGYIIPKSQWDTQAPYTYGRSKAPYGEVNSGGPDVAPLYHRAAMEVLATLHTHVDR